MANHRVTASLLALALGAGATDAASYLGLGHVFTANMTGNTVLLAIAAVKGSGPDAARSATALGGFCLGVAVGTASLRHEDRRWPPVAAAGFALEAACLSGLLVVWVAAGVARSRFVLIGLAAGAMGLQSAAVRASDVRGVNTTYMTSTLQNAIAGLVRRPRPGQDGRDQRAPSLPGAAWLAYGLGALGGAGATQAWKAWVIVGPLAVLCAVAAAALLGGDGGERTHGDS